MAIGSDRRIPSSSMASSPLAPLKAKASAKQSTPYPKPPQINDSAVSAMANNQQAMATAQSAMGSDRVGARGVSDGKAQDYYDDYATDMANVQGQMQAGGTNQQAALANAQANQQAEMMHRGEMLQTRGLLEGLRGAKAQQNLAQAGLGNQLAQQGADRAFAYNQTRYTNPASSIDALFR